AVLRAREAARLEDALLAGLELLGAEAVRHRARHFLADRLLHPIAVLRREDRRDAEARRLVERARAEARAGAVGEAFLFAHAGPHARGRGAAKGGVAARERGGVRMGVARSRGLAPAPRGVRRRAGGALFPPRRP